MSLAPHLYLYFPLGSDARVAVLLTPAQAALLADHPIPRYPGGGPSMKYLRSLLVRSAKGKNVEDPYITPDGTRCVRVDDVDLTDDRVFEEVLKKKQPRGDSADRFLQTLVSKEQNKQPCRMIALKLELVAVPAAAMADFGFHQAAIIGGVWGCMMAVSIAALWGFTVMLMLRFFPSVPTNATTSSLKRGASVIVFLLGLCWTAVRTYEFYSSFSGPYSIAGALAVLAIWGLTAFYSFGLAAWAAVNQTLEPQSHR
jgi:hypothetical protein